MHYPSETDRTQIVPHPHDAVWILEDDLWNRFSENETDPFDLLSAWWLYANAYHSGQGSKLYEILSMIGERGFCPGSDVQFGNLDETSQEVYDSILENNGFGYS